FPFGHSAGNGNARDAGQAGGNSVDIGEIHLQGVVHTLAELEGGDGGGWGDDHVHLVKRFQKIPGDESAHFLGFQVISIVVAGAQDVGAKHNAPLHLGAKPFAACPFVHLLQIRVLSGPESIAHTIVARQIRAGLSHADDVVAANGIIGVRKAYGNDLASQLRQQVNSLVDV